MDVFLNIVIYVLTFLIGTAVFSYANELIVRIPKKEKLLTGKSVCPSCGQEKKLVDMVPVFSYIFSKGKCRYCQEKQPVRPMLIELLGGILAVAVVAYYHFSFAALTIFLLYTILTIITFIDWDIQEIPPQLNAAILVLGVLSIWTIGGVGIVERIIGMFCISLPLYLIILVIPDAFGGGDIKMMFAAGFFLGWKGTLVAFFIGVITGGIYGVYMLAARKKGRKEHFAFGPFLSLGIGVSAYAGLGITLMNMYLAPMQAMMSQW